MLCFIGGRVLGKQEQMKREVSQEAKRANTRLATKLAPIQEGYELLRTDYLGGRKGAEHVHSPLSPPVKVLPNLTLWGCAYEAR